MGAFFPFQAKHGLTQNTPGAEIFIDIPEQRQRRHDINPDIIADDEDVEAIHN